MDFRMFDAPIVRLAYEAAGTLGAAGAAGAPTEHRSLRAVQSARSSLDEQRQVGPL